MTGWRLLLCGETKCTFSWQSESFSPGAGGECAAETQGREGENVVQVVGSAGNTYQGLIHKREFFALSSV